MHDVQCFERQWYPKCSGVSLRMSFGLSVNLVVVAATGAASCVSGATGCVHRRGSVLISLPAPAAKGGLKVTVQG